MEKLKSGIVWTILSVGLCIAPFSILAQELSGDVEASTQRLDSGTVVLDPVPDLEAPGNQVSGELLKGRFSTLQKQIPLVYHEVSHQFVEYFIYKRAGFTKQMLERKNLYFPLYEKALAKHNLPDELKYLSMIESGLEPRVISRAGAGGLWQFMRATGREFGLKQDAYIDERFDPVKSTDAACQYLKQLYRIFGDWELALASYNAGPGSVKRAIRRSGGHNFWTVYNSLPKETRNYVPQFVAMIYMMNFYTDHGGFAHEPEYPIASDTLHIKGYLDLNVFASLSGITLEEIKKLNPQILTSVLPHHTDNFVLKVPSVKLSMVKEQLVSIKDSSSRMPERQRMLAEAEDEDAEFKTTKLFHKVRGGETLGQIAGKYRVSVSQLKQWNGMRKNSIRKGQSLSIVRRVRIPRAPVSPDSRDQATLVASISNRPAAVLTAAHVQTQEDSSATNPIQQPAPAELGLTRTIHTVKAGESTFSIAGKYGITLQDLQGWNRLDGEGLKPGQQLTIVKGVENTAATQEKVYYTKSKTPKESSAAEVKTSKTIGTIGDARHTVRKGESLFSIASTYKISVKDLKEANNLSSSNLKLGQKLVIVGAEERAVAPVVQKEAVAQKEAIASGKIKPRFHRVQRGDTLWTISQRYGLTVAFLKKTNKIQGNNLKLGMKLRVSG